MKWEQVDDYTMRAKVHKGWLVKHYEETNQLDSDDSFISKWMGFAICFVPDPMHQWQV